MRILVAEDDHDIAELISHYLKKAGWSAHIATAGDEALAYVRNHAVDVVILDVMLPGMTGFDVCQAVRGDRATASLPVIMLTARTEEADRVKGLELGADDYVAKPFSPNELVARIRVLVRRLRRSENRSSLLRLGPITVDLSQHTVSDDGHDPGKLHDIVRNLVENALHYSPERAEVRLEAQVRDSGVDIVVSDSGPGVPAGDLDRVFERFYRVDKARANSGGVGLGLAIVKHLTELHGGRATVENRPEGGAQFTISLPARRA